MQTQYDKLVASATARPLCNIGQFDSSEVAALSLAVRKGDLVKRRAPFFGRVGATKTYWAANNEAFDAYQAGQVAHSEMALSMDAFACRAA